MAQFEVIIVMAMVWNTVEKYKAPRKQFSWEEPNGSREHTL